MGFEATFKALGDPTRRRILELLRAGEKSAGELAAQFGTTNATISHHLSVLRDAGLIDDEKRDGGHLRVGGGSAGRERR